MDHYNKITTLFLAKSFTPNIALREFFINDYTPILIFLTFSIIITLVMLLAAYSLSLTPQRNKDQLSEYECGFEPFDNATRAPFEIHFYIVGILFLIFDVEIALLFPWVVGLNILGPLGYYTGLFFIWVLILGFFYEWQVGALNWADKNKNNQISSLFAINSFTVSIESWNIALDSFIIYLLFVTIIIVTTSYNWSIIAHEISQRLYRIPTINLIITLSITLYLLKNISYFGLMRNIFYEGIYTGKGYFFTNNYTTFFETLILIATIVILLGSKNYLFSSRLATEEFPLLLIFASFFLILLLKSHNLMSLFVNLMGANIMLYTLIGINKLNHSSREAVMKYFVPSAIASGLLGFSIFNFMLICSEVNLSKISTFLYLNFLASPETGVSLAFTIGFFIVALFFKLSAFPGHFWVVDVYNGCSHPVMTFFLLPMKISVFCFFSLALTSYFDTLKEIWSFFVEMSSIISMIWGALGALVENQFKKLLAYASINQMGFFLLGLSCMHFKATSASLIYLIIYIITNFSFFTIFLATKKKWSGSHVIYNADWAGYTPNSLKFIFILILSLFSMAGIPPLNGFFAKFFLFYEAYDNSFFLLVITGMATSLISSFYYLNIINKFNQKKKFNPLHTQTFLLSNIILVISCLFILTTFVNESVLVLITNNIFV